MLNLGGHPRSQRKHIGNLDQLNTVGEIKSANFWEQLRWPVLKPQRLTHKSWRVECPSTNRRVDKDQWQQQSQPFAGVFSLIRYSTSNASYRPAGLRTTRLQCPNAAHIVSETRRSLALAVVSEWPPEWSGLAIPARTALSWRVYIKLGCDIAGTVVLILTADIGHSIYEFA